MPFQLATFQQHLQTANPNISRFKGSSTGPLARLLQQLGGGVNAGARAQIQPAWAAIPRDKQRKYAGAKAYLDQFVPGLADGIPCKPRMEYMEFKVMFGPLGGNARYPMRFYHVHKLSWESSNGDLASLSQVGTRERVTHRTPPDGAPFDPLMNAGIPLAFTQGATTNTGGNIGYNYDDHSTGNPSLIVRRPLVTGSIIADQIYEYTTDGINWLPIPGTHYEIEKGVRIKGGQHVFFFRKQSAPPHHRRFHFEVEYPIGPHVAVPGNRIAVVPASFASPEDIRDFARRVLHEHNG